MSGDRPGKKVVHLTTVHRYADPRIFHRELASLRNAGYDAHLIARYPNDAVVEGLPLIALRDGTPEQLAPVGRRAWMAGVALIRATRQRAALYQLHDPELLPLGYALKRLTGARVVYDKHEHVHEDAALSRRIAAALETWACGWLDHVVIAEEGYAEWLPQGTAYTAVLNYVQPVVGPIAPEEGPFVLAYSGFMAEERGLFTMLELMRLACADNRNWQLRLVGAANRPAERARADAFIAEAGLGDVVERIGWDEFVPHETLMRAMQGAHVGLSLMVDRPNTAISVPTKFYEYLQLGLPLLCSDLQRWQAFVTKNDCGAVVPPDDARAAYQVLSEWEASPHRLAAIRRAAIDAAPKYRWTVMGERLVALYDRLLSE